MRRQISKYLVSVLTAAMVSTSMPVGLLTVQAAESKEETLHMEETASYADTETDSADYLPNGECDASGTCGFDNGFFWKYYEDSATLTVTGEDGGFYDIVTFFPDEAKKIIFYDITLIP